MQALLMKLKQFLFGRSQPELKNTTQDTKPPVAKKGLRVITLRRFNYSEYGVLGVLFEGDKPLDIYTLEDPDNGNKIGESCIPEGEYLCMPHNGARFKNVWALQNVPGRSAILIHAGNTYADTSGCILTGLSIGKLNGLPAVLSSQKALAFLREEIGTKNSFYLEIIKGV